MNKDNNTKEDKDGFKDVGDIKLDKDFKPCKLIKGKIREFKNGVELTKKDKSKVDDRLNNDKKTKNDHLFKKGNKFGKGRPKGTYSFIPMLRENLKS